MAFWLGMAIALVAPQQAADTIPNKPEVAPCRFATPARLVSRKAELPGAARAALDGLFQPVNGIAEADAFFESSDAISARHGPRARFLRAYYVQGTWLIWFERGGIALMRNVVALIERKDSATGQSDFQMEAGSVLTGDLCAASKAFLAGVRSAGR
jgi:hypothetical protein